MGIQRFLRTMGILVLAALVASFIFRSQLPGMATTKDMDYSTFYTKLTAGDVKSVTTTDTTASVELKSDKVTDKAADKVTYDVVMPARWLEDSTLTAALHKASETKSGKAGLTWVHKKPWLSGNMAYLASMLIPLLLLAGFWIFMVKQSQAGAGQAMSFGKSRAKRMNDSQPKVTFADVAGVDEAKQELTEIIDFLKNPEKFQALGAKIPKGVLLLGNPGTGKTLLARAVAGEAGVPFFHISGSDFVEMFVGVGASRVRDLFEQAKAHRPAIVFIDEIDAVGRHRGAGVGGGHDEREQTLNQLLVEMDGFDPNSGVILMAATNRADVLDPALTRPGRFDRRIVVDNPDAKGRLAILNVHAKGKPIAEDVDMDLLARRTAGFSGADLANLLNEAALLTARREKTQLGESEFEESIERVVAGPERKSRIIQEREKSVLAYHEVGHALLGKLLPNTDSPHKVTILPRGMALGYTLTLPSEDRFLMSKSQMLDEITVLLGGRVAEQIVFNEITTGAQNDLERCTDIARRMVCEYGMTEKLGPLTLGRRHGPVFLGRDMGEDRNYSEDVAEKIDTEIRSIVDGRYQRATEILTENREVLDRISVALLAKETISSAELDRLIAGDPEPEEPDSSESQPPTASAPVDADSKEDKETSKPAPGLRPGLAGA